MVRLVFGWFELGSKTFVGKNVDISKLASSVESYLTSKGYQTQSYRSSDGSLIVQARKGGFLRAIVNAQRAFTIHISGSPDNVGVNIGVANWGQDIAVGAIEAMLVSDDLALLSGVEALWNLQIEKEIMKTIEQLVDSGQVSQTSMSYGVTNSQGVGSPQPAYPGYQGYQQPYSSQAGTLGSQTKYCTMCGAQNPQQAKFCMSCGTRFLA